jgi:diguanylate cyclase (GGDEF)-like protein
VGDEQSVQGHPAVPPVQERLFDALDRTSDVVGVTDDAGALRWLNRAGCEILGVSDARGLTTADLFAPSAFDRYYAEVRPTLLRGEPWSGMMPVVTPAGTENFWFTVVAEIGVAGEVLGLVTVGRRLAGPGADEVAYGATHDMLTGLVNRTVLEERLRAALARAARHGEHLALLFADVDGMKEINDTFGHAAGDAVLQAVAQRLEGAARRSDLVARIGGDEFVVLCDPVRGGRDAGGLASRFLAAVQLGPVVQEATSIPVRASFGVALAQTGDDSASLLRRADDAMYRAKERRSGVEVAPRAAGGSDVASEVGVALSHRRVRAAWRPVLALPGGQPLGWWVDPSWERSDGVVPADGFLPAIDRTPVAVAVNLAMLRSVIREGPPGDAPAVAPRVSVEVTVRALGDPTLPSVVSQVHTRSRVPVELELVIPSVAGAGRAPGVGARLHTLRRLELPPHLALMVDAATPLALADVLDSSVSRFVLSPSITSVVAADEDTRRLVRLYVHVARSIGADVLAVGAAWPDDVAALADLGVAAAVPAHRVDGAGPATVPAGRGGGRP